MPINTFEDRLRSLAARGFGITVHLDRKEYGEHRGQQVFSINLRKGDYGNADLQAKGSGLTLDQAAEAALRSAEAYLAASEPPAAIKGALGDMSASNLLPAE